MSGDEGTNHYEPAQPSDKAAALLNRLLMHVQGINPIDSMEPFIAQCDQALAEQEGEGRG